jgi:hypothetical protein
VIFESVPVLILFCEHSCYNLLRHLFIIVLASIIIFIYYYIAVLSPNSRYQLPNNLTLALKMEAVCSSETFLSAYKSVHVTSQKTNIESNWVFLKLIICRFWLYQKRKHRFSNNSNMNNRTIGPRVEAIIGWKDWSCVRRETVRRLWEKNVIHDF